MLKLTYSFIIFAFLISSLWAGGQYLHHDLQVKLAPEKHYIQVRDSISFPEKYDYRQLYFILHKNLKLTSVSNGITIEAVESKATGRLFGMDEKAFKNPGVPYTVYRISAQQSDIPVSSLRLVYEGQINHPLEQLSKEYERGFSETPGIISDQGVYLAGSSLWLPWFNDQLVTFDLTTIVDHDWRVVSQGKRGAEQTAAESYQVQWLSPQPMDEVFLIAARFTEYHKQIGNVNVLAFLRNPDPSLAGKYLETTGQYLEMYNKLIGQYPYSKFALIENFWETGYGMPSFTLLGEKVIRFPFILHSSYPHELLHNWWGNSVFVDYKSGNWCEGLTAYMADHLIKEQRGQGAEYRRSALQAYTDYVNEDNTFPLSEFTSRTDAASSSIGYNKSMMLFHMLRLEVGDDIFRQALQKFYRSYKFRKASFDDIEKAFEDVSGKNFGLFFDQWVKRSDAPALTLEQTRADEKNGGWQLMLTLKQIQSGPVYNLQIPAAITVAGKKEVVLEKLYMNQKEQVFNISLPGRPLAVDIDPLFDVFRLLDKNEIPPALSQIFGAEKVSIIIAAQENEQMQAAYQKLAADWASTDPGRFEIILDSQRENIPSDQAVWLFGRQNRFRDMLQSGLDGYDIDFKGPQIRIGQSTLDLSQNSVIVSARQPSHLDQIMVWLSADRAEAIPGLGRKLPHYGKYSYLAFEGTEPTNILKGQWPALHSPMSATVDSGEKTAETVERGKFPVRTALASLAPVFDEEQLLAHVEFLASEAMKGRGLGSPELDKAADYIRSAFESAGLKPGTASGQYFQIWKETAGKDGGEMVLKNVIGIIPGSKRAWADQAVVIGAHYDHLGLGWPDVREGNENKIHFGADDNASGIAVLLELARLLGQGYQPDRTIIFVAFTGEESGLLGSKYFIAHPGNYTAKKIIGMINLDTVGRLENRKILIINSNSASEWKHIAMGVGFVTGIEYELVSQDLDASDQVSFVNAGVPAIQIFSGPTTDYHRPSDTADKIDAAGMVKIATFTREALVYLAEREEPMTFTGSQSDGQMKKPGTGTRKVGTGMMPDFAFSGDGVRAGEVAPDSPAARAGLQKGDVIIHFGGERVTDLKSYSDILKKFKPGDTTSIVFMHEDKEINAEITLQAR